MQLRWRFGEILYSSCAGKGEAGEWQGGFDKDGEEAKEVWETKWGSDFLSRTQK